MQTRRIISCLLAVCFLLAFTVVGFAAEGDEGEPLEGPTEIVGGVKVDSNLKDVWFSVKNISGKSIISRGLEVADGGVVWTLVTGENGTVTTQNDIFPEGKYQISCVYAPSGYMVEGTLEFEVTENAQIVEAGRLEAVESTLSSSEAALEAYLATINSIAAVEGDTNAPSSGILIDAGTENAGIEFTITSQQAVEVYRITYGIGATLAELKVNNDGIAESGLILPEGEYLITATNAPEGSSFGDDEVKVLLNSGINKIDFAVFDLTADEDLNPPDVAPTPTPSTSVTPSESPAPAPVPSSGNGGSGQGNSNSGDPLVTPAPSGNPLVTPAPLPSSDSNANINLELNTNNLTINPSSVVSFNIKYTNFEAGKDYTITASLINKETGNVVKISNSDLTVSQTFTAKDPNGTVAMNLTFSTVTFVTGTYTLNVDVSQGNSKVASFLGTQNNLAINYTAPELSSVLVTSTQGSYLSPEANQSMVDSVSFRNLTPELTYTLKGVVMDVASKSPLVINGSQVTSEVSFVPHEAQGTVEMKFNLDGSTVAGKSLSVYETLLLDGVSVATLNGADTNQTVVVQTMGNTNIDTIDKSDSIDKNDKIDKSDAVKTGDTTNIWLLVGLMAVAIIVIVVVVIKKKRDLSLDTGTDDDIDD